MRTRALSSLPFLFPRLFALISGSLVFCVIGCDLSWAQGGPCDGGGDEPTPTWVSPGPDPFEGPVIVSVAPNRGNWMVSGVVFECRELAVEGGHGNAPWAQCLPQGAAASIGENLWGKQWNPCANAYGHDGSWDLKATVSYFKMFPYASTQKTIYTTVTLADIAILSATCDAAVPGLPPDARVIGVDPAAGSGPHRYPTFAWNIRTARPPGEILFNLHIYDLLTGQDLRTIPRSAIPNFALNGSYQWDPSQPPGQGVPRGLYGWYIGVVKGTLGPGDTTQSGVLAAGNMWAQPGNHDEQAGKLPVDLHVTFTDASAVAPSVAAACVVNASPNNPNGFSVVPGGGDLDLVLGAQTKSLELDPLDGHPYYLLVYAVDDHGGLANSEDRQHEDRPIQPKAVKLRYGVTEVYPNEDGRVFISDYNPVTEQRFEGTGVAMLYGNVRCQVENHQARVQAAVKLSVDDTIPGNEGTTTNLDTGGCTVHFFPEDPDSVALWDHDTDPNDNIGGTATCEPAAAVAVRTGPTGPALALTNLCFGATGSGDNHVVMGSPNATYDANDPDAHRSAVLTVWKLIHYELDRMPKKSGPIFAAVQGQQTIEFLDPLSPDLAGLSNGEELVIYNESASELADPTIRYHAANVRLEHDQQLPDLLHLYVDLDRALERSFTPAIWVARMGAGLYDSVRPELVPTAFSTAFVEFREETSVAGILPKVEEATAGFQATAAAYWTTADVPNYVQVMSGIHDALTRNAAGVTYAAAHRQSVVFWEWLWLGVMTPISEHARSEFTVHELGHVFWLTDANPDPPETPHVHHRNLDGHTNPPSGEGCVMLYDGDAATLQDWENDFEAGDALFGGPKAESGEPVDLLWIATFTDPLL